MQTTLAVTHSGDDLRRETGVMACDERLLSPSRTLNDMAHARFTCESALPDVATIDAELARKVNRALRLPRFPASSAFDTCRGRHGGPLSRYVSSRCLSGAPG